MYSVLRKKLVTVEASSHDNGKEAKYVYDNNEKTSWKPDDADTNPALTFDFGEEYAFDRFVMEEISESKAGYTVDVYDGLQWKTIFTADAINSGETVYLQGKTVIKAQKVRFVFDDAVELREISLNPYTNWAMEGNVVLSGVKRDGGSIAVPDSIVDGDRVTKGMEDGTGTSTDSERHSVTIKFPQERIVDTVRLISLQESEAKSRDLVLFLTER